MRPDIAEHLLSINRLFYQTFALQFSSTRRRLQPGVLRVLAELKGDERLLDLGCGNGELARTLAQRLHRGLYVGLDNSPGLLQEAVQSEELATAQGGDSRFPSVFLQVDLAEPEWEQVLRNALSGSLAKTETGNNGLPAFDLVFAFAVLHHLPGEELRRSVLSKVHSLLVPEGRFIHSNWQFLNSPRLQARVVPWERGGLSSEEVDPGDYLLDWRQGGEGLRYVHHFQEEELYRLAEETGFRVEETFFSDGEGGNLGLYQVWKRV